MPGNLTGEEFDLSPMEAGFLTLDYGRPLSKQAESL